MGSQEGSSVHGTPEPILGPLRQAAPGNEVAKGPKVAHQLA